MTKNLKYSIVLFSFPFIFNFLRNFSSNNHINFQSLFLSLFCFLFLYLLGLEINKVFRLNSISLSIVFYLIGMYIFNFLVLPFDKFLLSFGEIFLIYNILFAIYLLFKAKNNYKILIIFGLLIFLRIIFNLVDLNGFNYIEYNTDVVEFWKPMTEKIYNNDLFVSINENLIKGYPLMINYTFAQLHYLFIGSSLFAFSLIVPNLFFFLNILLIHETIKEPFLKTNILLIFASIVLNSDWLSYLFFNSLMGEVIVNYFFSVFLANAFFNKDIYKNKVYFFCLGFLYFLKPFVSILFLIISFYFFIKYKKTYYIFLSIIGITLNSIYNFFIFAKQGNELGVISDNVYFKILLENSEKFFNFETENIKLIIFNEIAIDKVLILFLFFYILISIVNIYQNKTLNIMNSLFLINLLLVFYLYTTVWKDIELGSAYRYIFSFLTILFVDLGNSYINVFKKS
tara:strand:- start:2540 stop:3904 length:1365 start_codon:yes stop_codon:yes gene_type:complete